MNEELLQLIRDTKWFLSQKKLAIRLPRVCEKCELESPPSKPRFINNHAVKLDNKPPITHRDAKREENRPFQSKEVKVVKTQNNGPQRVFTSKSMQSFLQRRLPNSYVENPLDDALAKTIRNRSATNRQLPQVAILCFSQKRDPLLDHLASAIDLQLKSARVMEINQLTQKQKLEDILTNGPIELIIAPNQLLTSSNELKPFYKEWPTQKKRFLGTVPLLLLPDLSLYYENPMLKRSLWNLICHWLKNPQALPKSS